MWPIFSELHVQDLHWLRLPLDLFALKRFLGNSMIEAELPFPTKLYGFIREKRVT